MDLNEQSPTPDAPRGGIPGEPPAADRMAASRRAMLRAGMIGIPAVTTLMARPAWAQVACFSAATQVSVEAAGFAGSSYQRALASGQCVEGPSAARWLETYNLMLQTEQMKLAQASETYGLTATATTFTTDDATGLLGTRADKPAKGGGPKKTAPPMEDLTVAALALQTGSLLYTATDGTVLFLGTFSQAFGGGPSLTLDEVLGGGSVGEQVFAAGYLNGLNRDTGNRAYMDYPLSTADVLALYAGEPVAGKRWSYGEAVAYLSTTMA